jgi:hypothetical protein
MTIKRSRLKHAAPFGERLHKAADEAREAAEGLPPGEARDALLKRVRQAETAARINEWLTAPTQQSLK